MKILTLLFFVFSPFAFTQIEKQDPFLKESRELSELLKKSLMGELKKKLTSDGAEAAVEFCHINVKPIAKSAAKNYLDRYEFGRTSHLIRNQQNKPQDWMLSYLERYKSTKVLEGLDREIVHKFPDGKKAYLSPLYVQSECLICHGDKVAKNLENKILKIYPKDRARGFTLGEFRGFIWIKQK